MTTQLATRTYLPHDKKVVIYMNAILKWDLPTLKKFANDDVSIYACGHPKTCQACGCRDKFTIADTMCINGDVINSPSRVDTLIKCGFIKLDDCKFLTMVLDHLEVLMPIGWSISVFEHLFYKMDRAALASYRIKYDKDDPFYGSILDRLWSSTWGHVFALTWSDYLFRNCGYTHKPYDYNIIKSVSDPSVVIYFAEKGYTVNNVTFTGLNLFMDSISHEVDFDIPAWSSVENAPPSVRRDSYGYTIWQLFRAYVECGLDLNFTDPKGRTVRDYFAHLKIIPSSDGVNDTGTIQEWYDDRYNP